MSLIAFLILALVIVPAFAFAVVGWLALANGEDDLQTQSGFDGIHFEGLSGDPVTDGLNWRQASNANLIGAVK